MQLGTQMNSITYEEELRLVQENCLQKILGNVFQHVPKDVLAVSKCPETS